MPKIVKLLRPLLIGQAPSALTQRVNGGQPFSGWSGRLLAALAGVSLGEFHKRVEATNLLDSFPGRSLPKGDDFPADAAKASAEKMIPRLAGRVVLLAGRAVAEAFGLRDMAFCERRSALGAKMVILIPHPSGINMFYDNTLNRKRVRVILRTLLGLDKKAPVVKPGPVENQE